MAGFIMGTASYMAPEQAKGKPVDRRADIWAFGVVFVEMLTGRTMYQGETVSETLASVIKDPPDLTALPAETPAAIRRLLRRCLDKDPQRRLQAIGEARIALDEPPVEPPATAVVAPPAAAPRRQPWLIAAAAALALGLAALAAIHFSEKPPEPAAVRFQIPMPEKTSFGPGMAISPDGKRLVFTAAVEGRPMLFVRSLDSLPAQVLPGTDSGQYPFWSPDSRSIAFFTPGKLKRVEASGGPPQTLCDVPNTGIGGSWNPDGNYFRHQCQCAFSRPAGGRHCRAARRTRHHKRRDLPGAALVPARRAAFSLLRPERHAREKRHLSRVVG
jgi:hypothetical protein